MGFENLMGKAEQIRKRAIHEATLDLGGRRHSRSYMSRKGPEIEAMFADIPGLYEQFTRMPQPDSFNAPIDELKVALTRLSLGSGGSVDPISTNGRQYPASLALEKVRGAADDVFGWSGAAAQEFKTGYLDPFPAVVKNQFLLVSALKAALEAEQAMWTEARKNIWDIADQTYIRLEHMDDACDPNTWQMVFTVVASICAVAAVPLTGGTSLSVAGVAITAVGATAQVVAAVKIEEPPKTSIGGESAGAVIQSMRSAVNKLIQHINETEGRIRQALGNINESIYQTQRDSNANRHFFCTRRPALADSNARNIRKNMGYTD
jgi:hypothetical protein